MVSISEVKASFIENELIRTHKEKIEKLGSGLLVVGGSYLYHSPPLIASKIAYLTGLRNLYLTVPSKNLNPSRIGLDYIVVPLPDQKVTGGASNKLIRYVENKRIDVTTALIGPGLTGIWREVGLLAYKLSKEHDVIVVLDKDSINSDVLSVLKNKERKVLVLHPRNVYRLSRELSKGCLEEHTLDFLSSISSSTSSTVVYFADKGVLIVEDSNVISYSPSINPLSLKYSDHYVFSGLLSGLLTKSVPIVDCTLISVYIYEKLYAKLLRWRGYSYELVDVVNLAKITFNETLFKGNVE